MYRLEQITPLNIADVVTEATKMKESGHRFVIIDCVDLGEKFDLLYQFDKDLKLVSYRLTVDKGVEIPSISCVFPSALLIENEIQDLFNIKFNDLLIDYHQKLLLVEDLSAPQTVSNMHVQFVQKKTDKKGGN